jgi:hypothetical protein
MIEMTRVICRCEEGVLPDDREACPRQAISC